MASVLDRAGVQGGLATLEDHQNLWDWHLDRKAKLEAERLRPPLIRLWDGDFNLRGEVAGERSGDFEFIENETGTASLQLPLDHYLAKWVMNHTGRQKRNVFVTFDKQGARWSGCMDHYTVRRDKYQDAYLDIVFKHDLEQSKHILCWANPALRPELQFPKLFVLAGPAKWSLSVILFLNLLRLESSIWSIPDDPLDPTEWMGPSFWPGFWRNQVKPFPIIGDNSPLTIVFSRFKTFHDVAKQTLADAQLTLNVRRYLDGDPHPYSNLQGELGIEPIEKLFEYFPIRHGCLIWEIVDNSEWGTETAFGGSWLTGLIRAVVNIADDGTTEGVSVFTGDPTYPGEYYSPWFLGTSPKAPWVVFEEGVYTGIEQSEFEYYEATTTSFVTGGQSMPGVVRAPWGNLGGAGHTGTDNSERSYQRGNQYDGGLDRRGDLICDLIQPATHRRHDGRHRKTVLRERVPRIQPSQHPTGIRSNPAHRRPGKHFHRSRGLPLLRGLVRERRQSIHPVCATGYPGEDVGNQGQNDTQHQSVRRRALPDRGSPLRALLPGIPCRHISAGLPHTAHPVRGTGQTDFLLLGLRRPVGVADRHRLRGTPRPCGQGVRPNPEHQ